MKKCNFEQNTIKVPQGNAWQLLLPLSTAKWRGQDLVTESIDYRALEDIAVFIDGDEWDYTLQENGILCDIPADMPLGPHNTVITATYFGVEVKASYFENFTIVQWSFESNVGEHLQDSPLISSPAYIYVGITDDQELEALKQQYRNAIASCETARLAYEASKAEYDRKAEALDDVAKQSTMLQEFALTLEAIAGIHIDIPEDIATEEDVTAAKQAILTAIANSKQDILTALGQIQPDDPYSRALAAFFNITAEYDPDYTPLTAAEAIAIARDCQYNVMGTDWPIPTWLPTGVTEAQVESAAEGLGIPYHEPTQTA